MAGLEELSGEVWGVGVAGGGFMDRVAICVP